MTDTALRLNDELLRLSEADRVELAHVLWDSLDEEDDDAVGPDDAAWIEELNRRSADADSGRAPGEPFRDVIAELRGEQP